MIISFTIVLVKTIPGAIAVEIGVTNSPKPVNNNVSEHQFESIILKVSTVFSLVDKTN